MGHLVFVYGTLKRGFPNYAAYMQAAEFVGAGTTVARYPLVLSGDRHVPCMLDRPGEGSVVAGELFRVDDTDLRRLDGLEEVGRPGGYLRRLIAVRMAGDVQPGRRQAFAYLMPPENVTDVRSPWLSAYSLEDARRYSKKARPGRRTTTKKGVDP